MIIHIYNRLKLPNAYLAKSAHGKLTGQHQIIHNEQASKN